MSLFDPFDKRGEKPSLSRTELVKRMPLMQALSDEELTFTELDNRLDISRSTIHRAVKSLCENEVIKESNGTFEITDWGAVILDELDRFSARTEAVCGLESFLNTVDYDAVDVPVGQFVNAEITEPKPRQPHYCVKRISELMQDADDFRLFTSVVSPFYVDAVCQKLRNGTEVEVILDAEAATILTDEYPRGTKNQLERGALDIRVHENIPFELLLFDERLAMTAHDDGIPQALVETDADGAIEWGESLYESYWRDSTALTKAGK